MRFNVPSNQTRYLHRPQFQKNYIPRFRQVAAETLFGTHVTILVYVRAKPEAVYLLTDVWDASDLGWCK